MIHRIHSFILLAPLALAIAGCGGGSDGPPDKLSEALLDSIQRHCQKSFDCKSSYVASMHDNQSFENYVGGATADACFNSVKTLFLTFQGQDYFTKLDASVAGGRIKYNPSDYDTCLKAGEAESCDQLFDQNGATATPPAACETVTVGLVATAGVCTIDDDCAAENDSCDETAHTCG
jgi:hypothetical protein